MASLYADENFNYRVVEILRRLGHDVLTVQEASQGGKADIEVLIYATNAGRAVLTFNHRHFSRLHHASSAHAGIISCTDDEANALSARIDQRLLTARTLAGQFIRIVRPAKP